MSDQQREKLESLASENTTLRADKARLKRVNDLLTLERDSLLRSLDASKGADGTLYASVLESALETKAQLAQAEARIVVLERELADRVGKVANGEGAAP